MKFLVGNPRKLHLKLTIKFALFFVFVSGLIYWYFSNKFEDNVLEIYRYKAKSISNYLEQIPETFWQKELVDKNKVKELMILNEASYVVLEDNEGMIIDAINIEHAEKQLYVNTVNSEDIFFSSLHTKWYNQYLLKERLDRFMLVSIQPK